MDMQDTTLAAGQGGDDARPQPATIEGTAEPPPPGQGELPHDDPEARELAAAMAAVEAEEKGAGAQQQQDQQQQASQGGQPAGTTAPAAPKAPPPVPYDRFKAVSAKARSLEEEVAFLRGTVEALKETRQAAPAAAPGTAPATQPAAPPPTTPPPGSPEAKLAEAKQRALEAAEKFDTGEITGAEFSRMQTEAAEAIAAAQVQIALRGNQPSTAAPSMTDEVLMEQHVAQLEQQNPVLTVLTQQQMAFLKLTAENEAAIAGQPYRAGARDTMRLREHVARLANVMAPHWGIKAPAPAAAPASRASNTQPPRQPGLTPQAQARLQKMDMAAGLPPDTARMGAAADSGEISEARILEMTDEELAALPATTRARFLTG